MSRHPCVYRVECANRHGRFRIFRDVRVGDRMLEYQPPPDLTAEMGEAVDEVIKYMKTTAELLSVLRIFRKIRKIRKMLFLKDSAPRQSERRTLLLGFSFVIFPACSHVVLFHIGQLIFTTFFAAQRYLRHLCIKAGIFSLIYFFIFSQK